MIIHDVLTQLEDAAGPVVKILKRGDNIKVIVLGFKKGMVLKEHKTGIATKLVIVEGRVKYREGNASVIINKFEDIDIPINELHSVEALDDSICFLIQG